MQPLLTHNGEVFRNYAKAVRIGAYDRLPNGLFGKFDNVRRFWEDTVTLRTLAQFLTPLLSYKRATLSRLRVIDLGCGSGAGYDFVVAAAGADMVDFYKGIDISPEMIGKAREIFGDNPKCAFELADLNDGLPASSEPPYDLYFSSYASLSHLPDHSLRRLLRDICHHMGKRAVFVADLLGRYSYEWQCYWDEDNDGKMLPYTMSYIYPPGSPERQGAEHFPMRFWGGEEFDQFVEETVVACGVTIVRRERRDRSILVGRHMDTRAFNPFAPPLRFMVNSLFEPNHRTDLKQLLFDYRPHPCCPNLNAFFERFQMAWNAVVWTVMEELNLEPARKEEAVHLLSFLYPEPVRRILQKLRRSIQHACAFWGDDPIANEVEPKLACALRELEQTLQQGLGVGHALLALYEFRKD